MRCDVRNNLWTPATPLRSPSLSLRFRFTLMYGLILTITLLIFGTVSYSVISQTTRQTARDTIVSQGTILAASLDKDNNAPSDMTQVPPLPDLTIQLIHLDGTAWLPARKLTGIPRLDTATLAAIRRRSSRGPSLVSVRGQSMLVYTLPVVQAGRAVGVLQVARSPRDGTPLLGVPLIALLAGCTVATFFLFGGGWLLAGIVLRPFDSAIQRPAASKHGIALWPTPPTNN